MRLNGILAARYSGGLAESKTVARAK